MHQKREIIRRFKGDVVGELALVSGAPRRASVSACSPVTVRAPYSLLCPGPCGPLPALLRALLYAPVCRGRGVKERGNEGSPAAHRPSACRGQASRPVPSTLTCLQSLLITRDNLLELFKAAPDSTLKGAVCTPRHAAFPCP
jgi:hypothetical protein